MKKRNGLILTLLLTTLVLSGVVVTVSAEPDATLVIISPHWEGITTEYERAFKAYYQENYGEDVDIEWIDVGGTSDVIKYVDSQFESSPDGIGIDLWWGGGVDPFIEQAGKGTLVSFQVDESVLGKIPSNIAGVPMYDDEYRWYGTALSGFGIVYNKVLLDLEGLPTPETWEDLTDPRCKGWVGSADPRHSGSTHMAYELILQSYGWEEGMKISTLLGANVKSFPSSSSAVPKSVGAGDVAYGLAIDQYAWSEVAKVGADKIGYVMPEGLTVINPDSIAILKGAPNLEVAQRFLTFTLTDEGQKLWMLPVGAEGGPEEFLLTRLSVVPSLYGELAGESVVPVNPFEMESTLDYDADLGSIRYSFINDLFGAMVIDSHEDLAAAWSDVIATENALTVAGITSTKIEEAKDKLGEVPLTWAEASVAVESWDDAEIRNSYISEWHTFALEKYDSATGLAAAARTELSTQLQSEREALIAQYEAQLDEVKAQTQNNLYMGLGGGLVVGAVIGYAIAYYMSRKGEVAAVEA